MNAPQTPSRRELAQMLQGNQVQQAIYVATSLGIADLLADGPKRSDELARSTGAHSKALYRLLRVLASFGIFAEDEQGRFELTPLASFLQRGTPNSMRAFALWSGGVSYQVFGGLEYSVRTGKPAFEDIYGMEFFEYLAQNPEVGVLFDELMSRHTAPVASAVAARDFSGANTVVDVGGGHGEILVAILTAHPTMRGVLVDHPRVIPNATCVLEAAGVLNRCTIIGEDILKSVPSGGDVYLLKSVVHGLDDKEATCLLQNCRQAMPNGAKLLVVEFVLPPGNDPFPGKLMDLLMLVGCNGRERTEEEFCALFAAAGFRLTNIGTIKNAYSVIEGMAA